MTGYAFGPPQRLSVTVYDQTRINKWWATCKVSTRQNVVPILEVPGPYFGSQDVIRTHDWHVCIFSSLILKTRTLKSVADSFKLRRVRCRVQPSQSFLRIGLKGRVLNNRYGQTLQALIAAHTAIGDIWISGIELLCALALVLPALSKFLGGIPSIVVPVAAICIAEEMLVFTGVHLFSGETNYSPIAYWLVVAALCAFVAYGRIQLQPL